MECKDVLRFELASEHRRKGAAGTAGRLFWPHAGQFGCMSLGFLGGKPKAPAEANKDSKDAGDKHRDKDRDKEKEHSKAGEKDREKGKSGHADSGKQPPHKGQQGKETEKEPKPEKEHKAANLMDALASMKAAEKQNSEAKAEASAQAHADSSRSDNDDVGPSEARIVAYSDSDDEEPQFMRIRRKERTASDSDDEKQGPSASSANDDKPSIFSKRWWTVGRVKMARPAGAGEDGAALSMGSTGIRGVRCMLQTRGAEQMGRMRDGLTWEFLLRLIVLAIFHRLRPKATEMFEIFTLAIPVPAALAKFLRIPVASISVPWRLEAAVAQISAFQGPVLTLQALKWLNRHRPRRRTKRLAFAARESVMLQAEQRDLDRLNRQISRPPTTMADWAGVYALEMGEMRRSLAAEKVRLPGNRFDNTNAEMMRFAQACGLMEAKTAPEKKVAIEAATQRVLSTLDWIHTQQQNGTLLPKSELRRWEHIVRWQGHDAQGRPIMVVRIAKACTECRGSRVQEVANAVISQVTLAIRELLSNEGEGPEQLNLAIRELLSNEGEGPEKVVVVMDAREATTYQFTRHCTLFRDMAQTLNQHFPARLHQLHLVELPLLVQKSLGLVLNIVHPTTRAKIRGCKLDDPLLPLAPSKLELQYEPGSPDVRRAAAVARNLERKSCPPELNLPSPRIRRRVRVPDDAQDGTTPRRRARSSSRTPRKGGTPGSSNADVAGSMAGPLGTPRGGSASTAWNGAAGSAMATALLALTCMAALLQRMLATDWAADWTAAGT
ncbi:hypothetical protein WJX72_008762 [[Myrmecia] bisecta]|uniref:CRAL-TRIO domain-containing protein n=1 Tax=[Myrmecia] bisecta TaxID=41462 RepID=A0AAW1QBT4_9CHLO